MAAFIQSRRSTVDATVYLTSSENTNNDALVRVEVAIDISGSIEFLLGSLDPVLAEVLSLVIASDLYQGKSSASFTGKRVLK